MSESDVQQDSSPGYSISTASDEQSSSPTESCASETQQLPELGSGLTGISGQKSVPPSCTDSPVPMDSNEAVGVKLPPAADMQHEMMEVAESPSEEMSMEVSPTAAVDEPAASEKIAQPFALKSSEQIAIPQQPSEGESLKQLAFPQQPSEGQFSAATRKTLGDICNRITKAMELAHTHYKTDRCDCLPITDEGGFMNPHKPQTRRVQKITERLNYKIKIDMPEFSAGDIRVEIVDNSKLSIHAKRDVDTEYGSECHEFQKILKIPADANGLEANFHQDGVLVVQLGRRRVHVAKKTKLTFKNP